MRETGCRPVRRAFHEDDGGFTTVGMVLALLVSLALLFSAAKVYKINSVAADVQNVADAAALAAENQVASFYIVAQVCDAVVLSLSLTSAVTAGAGAVALCIPGGQTVASRLLDASADIARARQRFAEEAADRLNALQNLLPYFAALQASQVARANDDGVARYFGIAFLAPEAGASIDFGSIDEATQAIDDLRARQDQVAQAAERADAASKEAQESKERAWRADCGNAPGYCMYERAGKLAGLSGARNPRFSSADTWSFSVALERARAYYAERAAHEQPQGDSVDEQANSALRARFYAYAVRELKSAYVRDTGDSFEAFLPVLPANTDEMRATSLFAERVYPVTAAEDGTRTMHAWAGCPACAGARQAGTGSVAELEAGGFAVCPECAFTPASLGSVAAASTSIGNGFEHWYRIVAEEAGVYARARAEADAAKREVQGPIESFTQIMGDVTKQAASQRIDVAPPGSVGAVAIVADVHEAAASDLFPSSFVSQPTALGARAALSAATLARDDSSETETVITSLLDGVDADAAGIAGAPKLVLSLWSRLLGAYTQGHDALLDAVRQIGDALPIKKGSSGLGTWAAQRIEAFVTDAGFEPAELAAWKPVTVNSWHVVGADGSKPMTAISQAKRIGAHIRPTEQNPLRAAIDLNADFVTEEFDQRSSQEIEIARIQLFGEGGPSVPLSITLPEPLRSAGHDGIQRAREALKSLVAREEEVEPWT